MDTRLLCPVCTVPLESSPTTTVTDTTAGWFCPMCRSPFAPCFHCAGVSSRCNGDSRTCLNRACSAYQRASFRCPTCTEWSLLAENDLSARCCNRNCPPTVVPTPTPAPAAERQAEPPHARDAIEQLLDHIARLSHFEERYEVRGLLAQGGMGRIFEAYDRILRRRVAVKLMQSPLSDAAARGQFLKEARIGGRLLHPNILAVLDLGVN